MTIRDFWNDIRERFRDDDHGHDRDWRGDRSWDEGNRYGDRDSYAADYDRSGRDRHFQGRGFMPMGVHGIDTYRDTHEGSSSRREMRGDDRSRPMRYESDRTRMGSARNSRTEQFDDDRWSVPTNQVGSADAWPDRYSSASSMRDYRGRGPNNWQRSDTRLYEDVCECLTEDDALDASDIEVRVEGGVVTLTGTVDSRNDKRHAEDLVERISGVRDVHNQLQVQRGRDTFLGNKDALRDSSLGH